MKTTKTTILLTGLFLLNAAGCASENHAKTADDFTYEEKLEMTKPTGKPIQKEVVFVPVEVDDTLAEICGMEKTRAYFKEDSASIIAESAQRLDALAKCIKEDLGGDDRIAIVGHTDPQGDAEYNAKLGKERAMNVARYLVEEGVASWRLSVASAGETKANEDSDEYAYNFDRRVDIRLIN